INLSKGERQRRINEAEGRARAIEITSNATAEGIKEIAAAIRNPGGDKATNFRIAEQFISQFGTIIETANTSVLPLEIAQLKSVLEAILPDKQGQRIIQSAIGRTIETRRSKEAKGGEA
ncbi:MAG: paraslipin, partial [Spirochaetales bacterium]|nr:paraslipin [Spirochaetales bacterium]